MPEHILSKPGPLTQESSRRFAFIRRSAPRSSRAVPFPYPVAPLILSHHERWDGKGYPQGIGGEDIPIGARILTIVDYYDAVTTERPYHKPLLARERRGPAQARIRTRARSLARPDLRRPSSVAARTKPMLRRNPAGIRTPVESKRQRARRRSGLMPARDSAFENIALAHREIYALYEIAQSMGTSLGVADTMALISSKLTKIVPWSGCALYLIQGEDATLKCRYPRRASARTSC